MIDAKNLSQETFDKLNKCLLDAVSDILNGVYSYDEAHGLRGFQHVEFDKEIEELIHKGENLAREISTYRDKVIKARYNTIC